MKMITFMVLLFHPLDLTIADWRLLPRLYEFLLAKRLRHQCTGGLMSKVRGITAIFILLILLLLFVFFSVLIDLIFDFAHCRNVTLRIFSTNVENYFTLKHYGYTPSASISILTCPAGFYWNGY
jgi:hypothetical protein